jgi:hypothetical protein
MTEENRPEKSTLQKIKDKILPKKPMERIADAHGILKEVGGMQPLFNIRDLEQRRQEIKQDLEGLRLARTSYKIKREVVDKVFVLFFASGSPWYRGLDNREKASKVADFIELYQDVRDLPSFMGDLFNCAMQLLNISFTEKDVTNTPAYVMQSTPIVSPYGSRVNLGGSGNGVDQGKLERVE